MKRSNIVDKLSELYPKLNKKEIDGVVRSLFNALTSGICKGDRIEIRGFGCFSLKERAAGIIRNPRDGVSIKSDSRNVIYFRAGKELKNRVNNSIK
jgi:integration host factor subunit beta